MFVAKDEILRSIGTLIESDAEVSRHILEALRHEMRNRYEYNETSILYELFQNADDASEQLYTINPNEETRQGRFEVRYDGETLIIAHWGRLINSVIASGGAGLVHREFKRDLENMLVLMQSGKKNTDIAVTGKFGLGFKTVFFVCDEPIVYSGGLRFKIHGGFLPQPLSDDDNEKYSLIVREFSDGSTDLKPTVFILPIVSTLRKNVEGWIDSFVRNSQTVCTLSKRISRMRIVTNNEVKSVSKVMEESVLTADNKCYVVNFSDGCLFFGNNDGIPCALPDNDATYWATVPTKLCLKMGVALNGNFDLTTGRAKINDSSEKNPKLVHQWSRQLFEALIKIREKTEDFDDGGYAFWRAIWDLFTVRDHIDRWENPETNLLCDLIWDEHSGGYRRYIERVPSIPSELEGALRGLCLLNDISHIVSRDVVKTGALGLLEKGSLAPGCAISEEVFLRPARKFLKNVKGLKKYGLYEFIADLKKERPVLDWQWCSSDAGMCLLKMLKDCEIDSDLRNELRDFLFMSNGSATKKAESLVGVGGHDEMRIKFVPADYQLSSRYDQIGIEIFKLIRGARQIHKDELARLAASASTINEQTAVLEYVLKSGGLEFAQTLVECNPLWFKDVDNNPYFISLDKNARMILAGMLDLDYGVVTSPAPIPQPPLAPEIDIRTLDWSLVVEWWKRNSEEYLCKYNDLVYNRREVCALPDDVSTFEKRSEWLELFVLSAAFSLGMRECQHKGFIRMLKNRRMGPRTLWEIYCDETIIPEDWMNTLDAFIEEEEFCGEYQYWMRLFMRIYQFASHLSEYVQFVKMIDNLKPIKSLESIWNVKKNPLLSGSGIDLPGLQKTLCARGQAFLVRELVRRKAISNPCIYPYCFVPKESLFNGEDSKSIYNRISYVLPKEDATFGGAFDIALVSYLKAERKDGIYYVF